MALASSVTEWPTVAVGILSWNSREMLAQCFESVCNQTYPAIHLRFYDNASSDGSVGFVRAHYPNIPVHVFPENLGYSRAHNHAIRETTDPFYMPLNPDLVLSPTYVAKMVQAIQAHPRVGAVAGKLLFLGPEGRPTRRFYSTGHLLTRSRAPANRGHKQEDTGQYERREQVFAANGAAPLFRREMLEDVALDGDYFCEDFFLYGDDQDLGWRARLRDWQCWYTPDAVGYHAGFGSGGIRLFRVQVQFTRNRYLTLARNDRFRDVLVDLPYLLLYELIQQAYWLARSPRRVFAHWLGLLEALRALPHTLKARRQIQRRRTASPQAIRSFVVSRLW